MNIRNFIIKQLGLDGLVTKVNKLEIDNKSLIKRCEHLAFLYDHVHQDNALILQHIKFINAHFFVAADIDPRAPSVVLIMQKGPQNIIKTYHFNEGQLRHIYDILEGFGKDNVVIDVDRFTTRPKFRY